MGESANDSPIGYPESAGAVGDIQTTELLNQDIQNTDADHAGKRLAISARFQEAGTDDHVGFGADQLIDQSPDFSGSMLTVAINLHGYVIAMQGGVTIARLHRATNAQVERKAYNRRLGRDLAQGVIGGTVVDHQHVEAGQRPVQPPGQFADRLAFIKRRYDHQAA